MKFQFSICNLRRWCCVALAVEHLHQQISFNDLIFRSSPQRWPNKPGKSVRRPYVHTSVRTSTIKLNAATNQIVQCVRVNETFTMIWLSRSSEVRVKVRRWPQSPIGTIFSLRYTTAVVGCRHQSRLLSMLVCVACLWNEQRLCFYICYDWQ